jgi:hypothetical protein
MAPSSFRFVSAVDWMEFRVTIANPSQPHHLRNRMPANWGRPYVTAETDDPSGTARTFTFRVQDPRGAEQFMHDVQSLSRPGDRPIVPADVQITAAEITLDGYHVDRDALTSLAEHLLWNHSTWASYPRITADPGRVVVRTETGKHVVKTLPGFFGLASASKAHWALDEGATLNLGHQPGERPDACDFAQRIYVKTHDSGNGESYRKLPAAQHRARYEVTLRGKHLPFTTIDQWRLFRFETLQREFFNWRRWKGAPLPPAAAWLAQFPHLGRMSHRLEQARVGRRRGNRRGTEPDSELNRCARNALRRLTREQGRPAAA